MNNIYGGQKKVHFLCLVSVSRETNKNVLQLSWNFVNVGSEVLLLAPGSPAFVFFSAYRCIKTCDDDDNHSDDDSL